MRGVLLMAGLLAVAASWWRFTTIDQRVFHGDEAVQAMRTALAMMEGAHPFDPTDHHGPLLHYLSALLHRVVGISSDVEMTSLSVRILPFMVVNASLVTFVILLRPVVGFSSMAVLPVMLFSPAFFFFWAYFIQEPLLMALSLVVIALLVRLLAEESSRLDGYALAVLLGLCFALKVSTLVLIVSIMAGLFASGRWRWKPSRTAWPYCLAFILPILLVYSAFLTQPAALMQFVVSVFDGASRGMSGAGHHHGPGFFLTRLIWFRSAPGPVWSEWPIVLFAGISALVLLVHWKRSLPWQRFLFVQSMTLLFLYVVIPYKTPWLLLTPIAMLSLLPVVVISLSGARWKGLVALPIVLLPLVQLSTLNDTVGRFSSDPRNPWVYSHTVASVPENAERIGGMLEVASDRGGIMAVIGEDYWPYPWYLRGHTNIGYWPDLPDAIADILLVPLVEAEDVLERLEGEYVMEYVPMRPEVPLVLFVNRDLWNTWLGERRQ